MSDPKPRVKFSPGRVLTHSEVIIDFVDLPPNAEFSVNITGPIPQPWWAMLKTDGIGQAQTIWRTQAAGDYTLKAKGDEVSLSEDFTVNYQAGEEDLISRGIMQPDRDVKTVEEPGNMGDTPSREMRAPTESDNPEVDDPMYRSAGAKPAKSKSSRSK